MLLFSNSWPLFMTRVFQFCPCFCGDTNQTVLLVLASRNRTIIDLPNSHIQSCWKRKIYYDKEKINDFMYSYNASHQTCTRFCFVLLSLNEYISWCTFSVVFRGTSLAIVFRDQYGYGLSQWETTLQFNVGSHWLSPYLEWYLVFLVQCQWNNPEGYG